MSDRASLKNPLRAKDKRGFTPDESVVLEVSYEELENIVLDLERKDKWSIDSPREVLSIIIDNSSYNHHDADWDHDTTLSVMANTCPYLTRAGDKHDGVTGSDATMEVFDEVMVHVHGMYVNSGIDPMCYQSHRWITDHLILVGITDIPF